MKKTNDPLEVAIYDKILNIKEILKLEKTIDPLYKKNKEIDARISELSTPDQVSECVESGFEGVEPCQVIVNTAGIKRNFNDISELDSMCGELGAEITLLKNKLHTIATKVESNSERAINDLILEVAELKSRLRTVEAETSAQTRTQDNHTLLIHDIKAYIGNIK